LLFAVLGFTMGVPSRNAKVVPAPEQAETTRPGSWRYTSQALQHSHWAGLHRLARKAFGYALEISTILSCIMCTCSAQSKTVDSTLVTLRILEKDLMNMLPAAHLRHLIAGHGSSSTTKLIWTGLMPLAASDIWRADLAEDSYKGS